MTETILNWLSTTGWRILVILVISVAVHFTIIRFIPLAIRRTVWQQMRERPGAEREKRIHTLVRLISSISAITLGLIALFIILRLADIDITAALAGVGVIGVAVGFGAQYLIRDLISGFFVLLENQYNVGDVIKTDDIAGIVEHISLRMTILRDLDGARHFVPNGEMRAVSNLTQEWSRAKIDVNVAYKEDLDRVMALMKKTWEEMAQDPMWSSAMISKTPSMLRVDDFGTSGVTIRIVGDTQPIKQWDVMGEYRLRIKKAFDREGIEIPYPHMKVIMGEGIEKDVK